MAISLPSTFKDVPLADLWVFLKVGDEIKEHMTSDADKAYWTGWHDAIAVLLGDLTRRPTLTLNSELAAIFADYRMEDLLLEMEEQMKRDNGSIG